ncbi:MAG TPA: hypothetical protein VJG32_19475 [Anaerolineae bacterium]|nr:hypothetical protein [Anaerolineae bacterium]
MSSNIHFFDNLDDGPHPTEAVRITDVRADLLPDRRRVVVTVNLTPFFEKPNLDVTLLRAGEEVRSLSVIGAMQPEMQLTLHLPAGDVRGSYTAQVDLVHEAKVQQTETVAFEVA